MNSDIRALRRRGLETPCAAVDCVASASVFVVARVQAHDHDEQHVAPGLEQEPVQKRIVFVKREDGVDELVARDRKARVREDFRFRMVGGKTLLIGCGHEHSLRRNFSPSLEKPTGTP